MFYAQYEKLCAEKGRKPSSVARELGLSPSAPGRWKAGSIPQSETLQTIAEYFNVSTDYLLYGGERQQNIMNIGSRAVSGVTGPSTIQWNQGGTIITEADGRRSAELHGIDAAMLQVFVGLDMLDKSKLFQTACEMAAKRDSNQ